MIFKLLLNHLCLLPILRRFLVFYNHSFLLKEDLKRTKFHNMPCLILDPKVKSLCLVSLFIGREEGVNIVEEYHKWTLYPILLKCYHYLQPIASWLCRSNNKCKLWSKYFWTNSQPKWASERTYDQGNVDFQMLPNGFQGYEVPSSMVGKAWNHVSYCCFFGMLNPSDCCVTNWDSKDFFFARDIYKLEKMLFISGKFRKVNTCKQKLAKWP